MSSTFATSEETDATLTSSIASSFADKILLDSEGNLLESCLKKPGVIAENESSLAPKKSVSFSTIEIHSHEAALGDNPAVTNGPPLTISWKSFEDQTVSLEDYESHRSPPRTKMEMLMPRMAREDVLLNQGYSRGEIKQAVMELAVE